MISFFKNRAIRKRARQTLTHARHLRNMREDVMSANDLRKLGRAETMLRKALKSRGSTDDAEKCSSALASCIESLSAETSYPVLREYFEILVVAVAVAMAFRTYFIQPFKIPTGSMEPTLNGIKSEHMADPGLFDTFPLKLVKAAVRGQWYREVRVREGGTLVPGRRGDSSSPYDEYVVAGKTYKVPKGAELNAGAIPMEYVSAGTVLWSGTVSCGDHVFVDKIRWNFTRPRRGDVIVFKTEAIRSLPENTHYIKRLIGLPGQTVGISPPNVLVNGVAVTEPESIARITRDKQYRLPQPGTYSPFERPYIATSSDVRRLGPHDYFVLGDNTDNSRDSKIWGPVPESNLVGPAFMVYWPFTGRWGPIR